MLTNPSVKRLGAVICSVALMTAQTAATAAPPGVVDVAAPSTVRDVALGLNGTLTGFVRDSSGRGKSNETVAILFAGNTVATVQTLEDGRFTIEGLREGTHAIKASGTSWPVRFWQAESAPPAANSGVKLVSRQVPTGGCDEVVLVPNDPPAAYNPPARPAYGSRGFLGRAFANYPLLTTAALLGAGIGAGIAIGSGSNSTPASP